MEVFGSALSLAHYIYMHFCIKSGRFFHYVIFNSLEVRFKLKSMPGINSLRKGEIDLEAETSKEIGIGMIEIDTMN